MLLKIVAWPLGLQLLSKYSLAFEELVRGSINPFRHSWSSNEVASFVSSVTYFDSGCKIIAELVPHTLSLLLTEISEQMEIEEELFELEKCHNVNKFIHVISLFSLNTKCKCMFSYKRIAVIKFKIIHRFYHFYDRL